MKKMISMLLTVAMVLSLFVGCGSGTTTTSSSTAEAESTSEVQTEETETQEQEENEEVESAETEVQEASEEEEVEETITISYPLSASDNVITFYQALGQGVAQYMESYNDSYIDQSIEEATGIDMQFIEVSDTVISEQYSLMIASGDWADVITCDQYYTGGTTQAYADEVIIELTDLVLENAPDYYTALYNTNEASISNVTSEGMILAIYSIKDRVYTDSGEMTRGDWLTALGLDVPTTLDELTEVFYAFKNTYGCTYTVKCDSDGVLDFVGAFNTELASLDGTDLSVFIDDGVVCSGYISDGYREYLEWFAGLYADGIINADFYSTTLFPDVFNGLVGNGSMAFWNSMADGLANIYSYTEDPDFQQVAIGTIVMNEGDVYTFEEETVLAGGGQSAGYAITANCENPELVLQFLNYFYTDAGAKLRNYGVEGETYTVENGEITYTEMITNSELGLTMNNALNFYTCVQVCPGITEAASLWACYTDEAIAAMEVWEPTGNSDSVYPTGAALTSSESDSISNRVSDIISAASEYVLKFMTGAVELNDDNWNTYLEAMNTLGIQDVLEVYQNAYDSYLEGTR